MDFLEITLFRSNLRYKVSVVDLLITTSRTNAGEIDAILNSLLQSPLECDVLAWLSRRICLPKKERPLARIGECLSFQT